MRADQSPVKKGIKNTMRALGLNFQKGRIRASVLDKETTGTITLLRARQITVDPELPVPELMERYASQFRILIDEHEPDLITARQVWDIKGLDAAVTQVAPFGIAAYVCNEKNKRFCAYTPQALKQPTRFNLPKGVSPLASVDGIFGSHPPYWDDIQKTSVLVAWRALLEN